MNPTLVHSMFGFHEVFTPPIPKIDRLNYFVRIIQNYTLTAFTFPSDDVVSVSRLGGQSPAARGAIDIGPVSYTHLLFQEKSIIHYIIGILTKTFRFYLS